MKSALIKIDVFQLSVSVLISELNLVGKKLVRIVLFVVALLQPFDYPSPLRVLRVGQLAKHSLIAVPSTWKSCRVI